VTEVIDRQHAASGDELRARGRAAAGTGRYLTFRLGAEVFALDIADVTEILEYRTLTRVPMMPRFIRGVLNLRGRVVPVVDLSTRFGQAPTELARRTSVVIVETGQAAFGILVDAVNEVAHFGPDDIEPAPSFGAGSRSDFVQGMARRSGDFITVLSVEGLLDAGEQPAPSEPPALSAPPAVPAQRSSGDPEPAPSEQADSEPADQGSDSDGGEPTEAVITENWLA
jgi:purine-binding chemotaxis protein CheW